MLLSKDKHFKEMAELAIVNYSQVDIIYKCGYFNDLKISPAVVIEIFKYKLSNYIPFKLYYQIKPIGNFVNICKFAVFIPSRYFKNIYVDIIKTEDDFEYTLSELIDKLWLEAVNSQKTTPTVDPKLYMSKDFVIRLDIDEFEQIKNSFDVFLPTEQNFKNSVDTITNLLLKAMTNYANERIDFLKYEFEIPQGINHELFLDDFNRALKYSFECCHLIVPDIKLRGSNIYDMFIFFPLYSDFDVDIRSIQNLIKTMWYKTLIKHGKGNIKTMFLLVLNFSKYNINGDLKSSNFSMGLYRLNRKVADIYRSVIKY